MHTTGGMVIIPEHRLCAFACSGTSQIIVVSLIDGMVQWKIDIKGPCWNLTFCNIIDSLIVVSNGNDKYYVIDVITDRVNVYSFSIPGAITCRFLLDRMVVWNDNEIQVVCFAPESLRQ